MQLAKPVEPLRVDFYSSQTLVGRHESAADRLRKKPDSWAQHSGHRHGRIRQQQVCVGEVESRFGQLRCRPIQHNEMAIVLQHIKRMQVAMAHHLTSWDRPICNESAGYAL